MPSIMINIPVPAEFGTREYWFCYHNSPVWYDGETVYANSQVETWEEAGFSGDGMRRTGNRSAWTRQRALPYSPYST